MLGGFSNDNFEAEFERIVTQYKASVLSHTVKQDAEAEVPDWDTEIGGLSEVKKQVEDMFGVT